MITLIWFFIMKYRFNYPYTLDQISNIILCGILEVILELLLIVVYKNISKI